LSEPTLIESASMKNLLRVADDTSNGIRLPDFG